MPHVDELFYISKSTKRGQYVNLNAFAMTLLKVLGSLYKTSSGSNLPFEYQYLFSL